ncbi:MAG: hypothetical protein M1828_002680 [Chrysothrix sp. TS-e1954]|nr:MAG: hypothetical protein M1828_002680 [Chrysothrix sp. TS-e1954]
MTTKESSTAPSPAPSEPRSRPPSADRSGASTPTTSVPSVAVEKTPDDSSKLRTFLSILKRFVGVTDIAAVRFSLPANLLEPIPNLEYWHYLDRPETFASIADSDDPLGRMLGALRFWFTKDLKYVKGKPCKPYNSTLGEFFRCNWEVSETAPPLVGKSSSGTQSQGPITVSYLTEQTSHHPPVSAYYIECPEKGISGQGFDQLSANFTGTRIRVAPGEHNKGIYITLHGLGDETYNLTHPTAHLSGLLRGSLSITVADTCYVTCAKTRLKAILHYLDEGWVGKSQNRMQGVVFKYDPNNNNKTRIKDVPDSDVIGRIEGCWQEQIYFTRGSKPFDKSTDKQLVVDLQPLFPTPKIIPPENDQLPNESRKRWAPVTDAIVNKQYQAATTAKQEIEERQRQKAAERKARNVDWKPRFFTQALGPKGKPELTEDGRDALTRLHNGDWHLERSIDTGA